MLRSKECALFLALSLCVGGNAATERTWREVIPPTEGPTIEAMARGITAALQRHRDAHAKAHGCVDGIKFTVLDKGIPASMKVGLFAEAGKTFDAVVRLSNGSDDVNADNRKGGGQGMALKVLFDKKRDEKLVKQLRPLVGEEKFVDEKYYVSQDFLGINRANRFFVKNVADYVEFSAANRLGDITKFLRPEGKPPRVEEGRVLGLLAASKMKDPLVEEYHSMVPSRLGEHAVKYRMSPCTPVDPDAVKIPQGVDIEKDPNFPTAMLRHHLQQDKTCYKLSVLAHTATSPDIENAVADWGTEGYVDVATFEIPQRTEKDKELMDEDLCEAMAFTPWHTLPEHLPIGGIQRARERIYVEVANQRNRNRAAKK